MKKFAQIGLLLALVCFAAATWVDCGRKKIVAGAGVSIFRSSQSQFRQKAEELTENYSARNRELLKQLEQELSSAGEAHWNTASSNVPGTVKQFSKFGSCTKLCFKMAKDKITGSSDASGMIADVIGPEIITPCEAGGAAIQDALNNFLHKLQENDNNYRAELAQVLNGLPQNNGIEAVRTNFLQKNQDAALQIQNLAIEKTLTAVGTAIEVIFIRQSCAAIVKVCGHIIGKLVTTGSASAICAVADGPLPFLDVAGAVLAVGGFAWCAYDIYKVQKVLPGELTLTLKQNIGSYRADMKTQAWKHANAVAGQWEKASRKLVSEL